MKKSSVVVSWPNGIHMRTAARLVKLAQKFTASITFKFEGCLADARSVLSVLALCAMMGTVIDVEVVGEDEHDAAQAIEQFFKDTNGMPDAG